MKSLPPLVSLVMIFTRVRSEGRHCFNKAVVAGSVATLLLGLPLIVNCAELPSFLPTFYTNAFSVDGQKFTLIRHTTKDGVEQYLYGTPSNNLFLSVEKIKTDAAQVNAVMGNIFRFLNNEMDTEGGEFFRLSNREMHAQTGKDLKRTVLVYALPSEVQIWSYSGVGTETMNFNVKFEELRRLANRQRYSEALAEGNVTMGTWGAEIHEFALDLLKGGNKVEALNILQKVLATSPNNLRAHMDLIKNWPDAKASQSSARIVVKNAEDRDLVESAMRYLKKMPSKIDSVPFLEKAEKGLKVVLVPLEPCDLSLLADVATTYSKITGIPVMTRRLKEPFLLRSPDRIPYQRAIQQMIIKLSGENTTFTGWSKDKYLSELTKAAEPKDAWTRYNAKDISAKVKKEEGQYLADPYLEWFLNALDQYKSDDIRTMYVGITTANIYSGDNNFLFSLHMSRDRSRASILSYHMMQAKNTSEQHESRQRLIERIAKELVPASLKSLGIPRSTDPTCPYSYSDGVSRLDEKKLQLSEPVITALNGFRKSGARGNGARNGARH